MKKRFLLIISTFFLWNHSLPHDQPVHPDVVAGVSYRALLTDLKSSALSIGVDGVITDWIDRVANNALEIAFSNMFRLLADPEERARFLHDAELHESIGYVKEKPDTQAHFSIPLPEAVGIPVRAIFRDQCRRDNNFLVRTETDFLRVLPKAKTVTIGSDEDACAQLVTLRAQVKSNSNDAPTLLTCSSSGIASPLTTKQLKEAVTNGTQLSIWQQFPDSHVQTFTQAVLPPPSAEDSEDQQTLSPQARILKEWKRTGRLKQAVAQIATDEVRRAIRIYKQQRMQIDLHTLMTNGLLMMPTVQQADLDASKKRAICSKMAERLIERLGKPIASFIATSFTTEQQALAQHDFNPFAYLYGCYDHKKNELTHLAPSEAALLLNSDETRYLVFIQHRPGFASVDGIPDATLLTRPFFLQEDDQPDVVQQVSFETMDTIAANPDAYPTVHWQPQRKLYHEHRYVRSSVINEPADHGMELFEEEEGILKKERIKPLTVTPGFASQYAGLGTSLICCHLLHSLFRHMRASFLLDELTNKPAALAALLGNQPTNLDHEAQVATFIAQRHTFIKYGLWSAKAFGSIACFIVGIVIIEQLSTMISHSEKQKITHFAQSWGQRLVAAFHQWRLMPLDDVGTQLSSLQEEFQHELLAHLKKYGIVTIPLLPLAEFLLTGTSALVPDVLNWIGTPARGRYNRLTQSLLFYKVANLRGKPHPAWYHTVWRSVLQKVLAAFFMLRHLDQRYTQAWGRYVASHQAKLKQLLTQYDYYHARGSKPEQILARMRSYIHDSMPLLSNGVVHKIIHRFTGKPSRHIATAAAGYHAMISGYSYANALLLLPVLWEWLSSNTAIRNYPLFQPHIIGAALLLSSSAGIGWHYWKRRHHYKKFIQLQESLKPRKERPRHAMH